jgi:hypothetical protein
VVPILLNTETFIYGFWCNKAWQQGNVESAEKNLFAILCGSISARAGNVISKTEGKRRIDTIIPLINIKQELNCKQRIGELNRGVF